MRMPDISAKKKEKKSVATASEDRFKTESLVATRFRAHDPSLGK
jgi:hypothetical protein